jgi:hypothetical protein
MGRHHHPRCCFGLTERKRFREVLFEDVAGRDTASLGDELSRQLPADSGTTARHDGHLSRKIPHDFLLRDVSLLGDGAPFSADIILGSR